VDEGHHARHIEQDMTAETRNFLLRYVGARFDKHRLPLDVLPDLSAFRDLLVAFVKAEWRATHEKRVRLPKGFEKSIAFDLAGIGEGSAVPKLEWDRDAAQLLLPDFRDELEGLVERAYFNVVRLIDGAAENVLSEDLPPEGIRALNRFGSGLLDDEKIEFLGSQGKNGNVVYLNSERRKRLITRGRDSYQARFEDIGKLRGSDKDPDGRDSVIFVQTERHGRIVIPVPAERVKEEFGVSADADVQFRLMIELDNRDNYRRVVETFDVDVIDAKVVADLERCRKRIECLSVLQNGWHDGSGAAPSPEAVATAKRLLSARPQLAGGYRLYPTDEGGIMFEFLHNGWDYSVDVLSSGKIEVYGVQVDGPDDLDATAFEGIDDNALTFLDGLTGDTW
jgi:hypothetical protein